MPCSTVWTFNYGTFFVIPIIFSMKKPAEAGILVVMAPKPLLRGVAAFATRVIIGRAGGNSAGRIPLSKNNRKLILLSSDTSNPKSIISKVLRISGISVFLYLICIALSPSLYSVCCHRPDRTRGRSPPKR